MKNIFGLFNKPLPECLGEIEYFSDGDDFVCCYDYAVECIDCLANYHVTGGRIDPVINKKRSRFYCFLAFGRPGRMGRILDGE